MRSNTLSIIVFFSLLSLGWLMVLSASIPIAVQYQLPDYYFALRQAGFILFSLFAAFIFSRLSIEKIYELSLPILILSVFMLAIILIPGIAPKINGSIRWLKLGPISIQMSELAKLAFVLYLPRYLSDNIDNLKDNQTGFIKPLCLLSIFSVLILLEPDFGATVVLCCITLGLLFVSGVPLLRFGLLLIGISTVLSLLIYIEPYRIKRLLSFLNPWDYAFDSGYQLTQSLIAIARGGWFGEGLGNSIQKLHYLPEPHTDFIFAVFYEETGMLGALVLLSLYLSLFYKIYSIAKQSMSENKFYPAFIAYGALIWLVVQVIFSIGVNIGLLPTKGISLPFFSYGGSGMVVLCILFGVLYRIDKAV